MRMRFSAPTKTSRQPILRALPADGSKVGRQLSTYLNGDQTFARLDQGRNAHRLSSHSKMLLAARSRGRLAYL